MYHAISNHMPYQQWETRTSLMPGNHTFVQGCPPHGGHDRAKVMCIITPWCYTLMAGR
jgi:hypothetical protein